MKKSIKYVALLLCLVMAITGIGVNGIKLKAYAYSNEATHIGTVNVSDGLNVRSGPGTTYNSLGMLDPGEKVNIYGSAENGWYKIAYNSGFGYVSSQYIKDVTAIPKYDFDADFETNLTKQNFPESYKVLLRELHAKHPGWIFTADHLSVTWADAVTAESKAGVTLVSASAKASWKAMIERAYDWEKGSYIVYDSGGWVTAERDVIEYYMEPRNFLNENYIYMFLDQSYNKSIQSKEGLQKILNGTFMEGDFPEDTYDTYADVLMDAAEQSGVSPYVLAASIIIEQGSNGKGASISGTQAGYEGIYNFFNVRAYAAGGYTAVEYGLMYAAGSGSLGRPWNTRAKSIIGGAKHYASGYVNRGQDNLYYKKFNVIVPDLYKNQYMTNVQGAYLEASRLKNAYASVNSDAQLTFAIPVYKNMPSENKTALPTSNGANNYYITSLKVDGDEIDNFSKYKNDYELIVESSVSSINVTASVPSGASVKGTGAVALKHGKNSVVLNVTAASGKTAVYTLSVFRKGNADEEIIPEPTIEGSYTISTHIRGVAIGTNVSDFVKNLGVKNGEAKVLNSSGSPKSSSSVIVTGDKVVVYDKKGKESLKYDIIIYGDLNSDGRVSITDLVQLQKHLIKIETLKGNSLTAGDLNHDGKASIIDLVQLQKHILKIESIKQ